MTHASNILGTVNPVAEVAKRVHAVGGRLCVDAVAYAPHRLVDVQASGADAYIKIRSGASLVQLYSGLIYKGPELVRECVGRLGEL